MRKTCVLLGMDAVILLHICRTSMEDVLKAILGVKTQFEVKFCACDQISLCIVLGMAVHQHNDHKLTCNTAFTTNSIASHDFNAVKQTATSRFAMELRSASRADSEEGERRCLVQSKRR